MFDLRRFARLAAVQWAEHGRSYLWFLAIGVAIHLCSWLLVTAGGRNAEVYALDTQAAFFIVGYVLTGCLFALRYFSPLSSRESALTFLMRPASTAEKFLLSLLVVAVLYPLAYTLAFQICNIPAAMLGEAVRDAKLSAALVGVGDEAQWPRQRLPHLKFGPYLPLTELEYRNAELQVLLCTTALQALTLAGTLYFRKVAWLKTMLALFVLIVLAIPLLAVLTDSSPSLLFWGDTSRSDATGVHVWLILVWALVPALFWSSLYFFLRERELQ